MEIISHHLLGDCKLPDFIPASTLNNKILNPEIADIESSFNKGMRWFDDFGVYINNGLDGVLEGLNHSILPNGEQLPQDGGIRADCSGEVAGVSHT